MCGRMQIIADPLSAVVSDTLGLEFSAQTNLDLRPTQEVASLVAGADGSALCQLNTRWGIKPPWSKSLLINAQAETVAQKKTFADAFAHHRCLVPCSGWFEWRDEGGARKQKYLFQHAAHKPLFMAGICFPRDDGETGLVTLTIAANASCAPYHVRMPLLIPSADCARWLLTPAGELTPLLAPLPDNWIHISAAA